MWQFGDGPSPPFPPFKGQPPIREAREESHPEGQLQQILYILCRGHCDLHADKTSNASENAIGHKVSIKKSARPSAWPSAPAHRAEEMALAGARGSVPELLHKRLFGLSLGRPLPGGHWCRPSPAEREGRSKGDEARREACHRDDAGPGSRRRPRQC